MKVDSWILKPGDSRHIRRRAHDGLRAIGIFAGYRDLPNAAWRLVHPVAPPPDAHWYRVFSATKKIRLIVRAQARGLSFAEPDAGKR